jgi:hypothetical protein
MEANSKAFKLAKQYEEQQAKRQAQDQAAEQEPQAEEAEPGECADAQADDSMAGIEEQDAVADAAVAADGNGDADPPSAAAGSGEAKGLNVAAAAAGDELTYQPSWARGGGGRGRAGGRFRGIDPIYPVEDPKILEVRTGREQGRCLLRSHAMRSSFDGITYSQCTCLFSGVYHDNLGYMCAAHSSTVTNSVPLLA